MASNAMLWGEMGLISMKLLKAGIDDLAIPAHAASLMDISLRYIEAMYEAMREHADDHAYLLQDAGGAAVWCRQRDGVRASNQFTPGTQLYARRLHDATVSAETKSLANKKAGTRGLASGDDAMPFIQKASRPEVSTKTSGDRNRSGGAAPSAGGQPKQAPMGGAPSQDGTGSRGG
jgi:hypothetical protein